MVMMLDFVLVLLLVIAHGTRCCANNIPKVNDSIKKELIGYKYKLNEYLGGGGYGMIYSAHDVGSGKSVAIKLELRRAKRPRLKREATVYKRCNGTIGFPEFYWHGDFDIYYALVIEKLGHNLKVKLEQIDKMKSKISVMSTYMPQMIDRLEYLHSNHFLHHDVSPRNFVMGLGPRADIVHLIDFGSALYHRVGKRPLFTADRSRHVKTLQYCSAGAMQGHDYTPLDDLIALGYTFLGLTIGLPWGGVSDPNEILQLKMDSRPDELCGGLPQWCVKYFKYLEKTARSDAVGVDYIYLRQLPLRLKTNSVKHGWLGWIA